MATVHTIIRTTIGQYSVNQAVTRGVARAKAHPGSVTFSQRFGSALNLNLHYHLLCLEGVYVDRTDQGLKPRFVTAESPTDADIAKVVQEKRLALVPLSRVHLVRYGGCLAPHSQRRSAVIPTPRQQGRGGT